MAQRPVGPYLVEERLASGGMAEVFVARRVGPHGFSKRVALKRILPQFVRDADFVAMFIDEARLAARLDHPCIVHVFDFGELHGDLFLAMELVDGTNVNRLLRNVAARGEAVSIDVALHIAAEVSRALAYAHALADDEGRALGLVHRDVSPANILLTRSGHVKLSDFGIARAATVDQRTDPGRLRGKLGYMSPEQVTGALLDGRSDVFTLATVLAEMLVAEPLFGTGSDLDVLLRIRDVDLKVLAHSEKRIPAEVLRLLHLGLTKDPQKRPSAASFGEMIDEVTRRRGMRAGEERLARELERLELVPKTSALRPPDGFHRPTSLIPLEDPSTSVEQQEVDLTSPAIYRLRAPSGRVSGPYSFPKLVEMLTTGLLRAGQTEISKGDEAFTPAAALPELTRFVTSPALQWKTEETAIPTKEGRLLPVALVAVAHDLCVRRETGVLHLSDGSRRKKIYFVEGRPEFVASTDRRELLGEFLVDRGLCMKMEVDMALALLPRYGGRLGDALVGLGVLRPVELFRAIADQVCGRYLEAFRWARGTWVYVRGARSHEETFPLGRDPYELLRDAVMGLHSAALDAYLTPIQERVVELVDRPATPLAAFRVPPEWELLLRHARGGTTASALITRHAPSSGLDPETAYRVLGLALSVGLLRAR